MRSDWFGDVFLSHRVSELLIVDNFIGLEVRTSSFLELSGGCVWRVGIASILLLKLSNINVSILTHR